MALLALILGTVSICTCTCWLRRTGSPGWVAALTPAVRGRDDRGRVYDVAGRLCDPAAMRGLRGSCWWQVASLASPPTPR